MVTITVLDTCVVLISGLIIFPTRFAFGVKLSNSRNLIFITLPNIFNSMRWKALGFHLFPMRVGMQCAERRYSVRRRFCSPGPERLYFQQQPDPCCV